jgi:abhydrolase domain-containing protein 6
MESQVARINRFAEVLKLDQFHLAGNSMGGALAASYSAKYEGRVLTVALLAPAGVPSQKKSEFVMQMEKGRNLLLPGNTKDYDDLLALIFVKPPPIPAPFKKIFMADMAEHKEFNAKIWKDWQPEKFSLAPVLPLILSPVLMIWGDQDKIVDVGGVAFLEKHLKTSKSVIMKDTGHTPMIEKPEESAQAYLNFLKEKR